MRTDDPEIELVPSAGWKTWKKRLGNNAYVGRFPATVELLNPSKEPRRVELELAGQRLMSQEEMREHYELEVEYVDREIGRLFDFLDGRHLLDNTLVVFITDHGEGLGQHNHFGHISQLYDTLLRVGLIMAFPGRLPEGMMVDEPVGLVDVLPTVLELMDLESPSHKSGASLLPLITRSGAAPRAIVAQTYRPEAYSEKRALVQDGYKYIHSWTDDREWEELYDLNADPDEVRELSRIETERLAAMREALQERLREAVTAEVMEAELDSEDIERLRALGYIH